MSANGQLLQSELAPIPGGFLAKDAAAAFNAMNAEALRRFGRNIGVKDSYRPLGRPGDFARGVWSQWAAWERYKQGGNKAAFPGTSNHGKGLAVDVTPDGRMIIDAIGAAFGWAKKWSDAPTESWHIVYRAGIWHQIVLKFLPLHAGVKGHSRQSSSPAVYGLTRRLQTCGYLKSRTSKYSHFVEMAVRNFQHNHHLTVDGIVGPQTWLSVKAAADRCAKLHRKEV